jgi:hypothetical protein
LAVDCAMMVINLIVIGLMVERIIRGDDPTCKALAISIISILAICVIAEILFINYDNYYATYDINSGKPLKDLSSYRNAGFGLECVMVAPVGLMCLITSIKTLRQYITK